MLNATDKQITSKFKSIPWELSFWHSITPSQWPGYIVQKELFDYNFQCEGTEWQAAGKLLTATMNLLNSSELQLTATINCWLRLWTVDCDNELLTATIILSSIPKSCRRHCSEASLASSQKSSLSGNWMHFNAKAFHPKSLGVRDNW